ncbi:hypothetical protein L7F22_000484 [Adiantum nelumboides]|nr:hypothetical protein [Adiantum nelumboides]
MPISIKRLSKPARTRAAPVDKDEMYAYVKEEMTKVEARMLECMIAFKSEMMGKMHTLGISIYVKWKEEMQTYSQKEMTAQLKVELIPLEGKIHAFMAKDMLKLAHEGLKAEGKAMKEACKQEVSTAVETDIQRSKEAIVAMEASVSKVKENVEKRVHTWAEMAKDAMDKEVKECAPWIDVVKKNKGMPSNQTEVMNATLEEEAKRKELQLWDAVSTPAPSAVLAEWTTKDNIAHMEIILHCGDRQVQMVRSLKLAEALWSFFQKTYEHTDLVYQVSLIKRLVNTNMQEGQSATKFVDAWQALLDEVIISGLAVPETLQTMILLAALPSSWRAFITIQASSVDLQLQPLVAKILQEDALRGQSMGAQPVALATTIRPANPRGNTSNRQGSFNNSKQPPRHHHSNFKSC